MSFHLSIWSTQVRYPSKWEWEAEKVVSSYGLPYRAQYPCGKYFVDLALPQYRLAIEIDDKGHGSKANKIRDSEKTAWLENLGWRILRLHEDRMAADRLWPGDVADFIIRNTTHVELCEDPFEFRGDYYGRRAKERKAKKLKKEKAASKKPKAPAKVSRKETLAAKLERY